MRNIGALMLVIIVPIAMGGSFIFMIWRAKRRKDRASYTDPTEI